MTALDVLYELFIDVIKLDGFQLTVLLCIESVFVVGLSLVAVILTIWKR